MIDSYIHWNVNPEIFRIGSFAIRWYGLLFASGFFFGYIIMDKFFKIEKVPQEVLDKLTIYMAIGTVVGARLGEKPYPTAFTTSDKIRVLSRSALRTTPRSLQSQQFVVGG